jgi:hypothetical protein
MSVRWALPLLLVLSACSGGEAPVTEPAPTSPSAVPAQQPAEGDLVLAVAGPDGLVLHRLEQGSRTAEPFRELSGPDGAVVSAVSLSSGQSPTVCVLWGEVVGPAEGEPQSELHCYAPGATSGRLVSAQQPGPDVAVRADGRAVAWTEGSLDQSLVVADLDGDRAQERLRERYAPDVPPDVGLPQGLHDLSWVDEQTLAVTDVADSDEGRGLCLVDLADPRQQESGFGRCLAPGPGEQEAGFALFEQAVPVAPGEVVTVERPRRCCDDAPEPGARAVRIRLADGDVLEVVAFPREDRDVVDLSGGPSALVYVTGEAFPDRRLAFSVRWSGEERGAPLTGLPSDTTTVVAQP